MAGLTTSQQGMTFPSSLPLSLSLSFSLPSSHRVGLGNGGLGSPLLVDRRSLLGGRQPLPNIGCFREFRISHFGFLVHTSQLGFRFSGSRFSFEHRRWLLGGRQAPARCSGFRDSGFTGVQGLGLSAAWIGTVHLLSWQRSARSAHRPPLTPPPSGSFPALAAACRVRLSRTG